MLAKYTSTSKVIARNLLKERLNTYCIWLWNSAFIDYDGNVYTCCHNQPGIIGNINRRTLGDIWTKSIKLKVFRSMSSKKSLHCFFGCNVLPNTVKSSSNRTPLAAPYPKRLWVLHNQFCNIDCVMCDQDHKSTTGLDNDILMKNIDWKKVDEIDLQGGEILALKKSREMYLWLTQAMQKKVNLITNGLLINDDWADYLVRGANWIQVSVNAATQKTHESVNRRSNFKRVINNLKKLIDLKRLNGLDVEIIYKFTIVRENIREIGSAIELADSLGCDTIAFGYKNPDIPILLNEDRDLKEKIRCEISALINAHLRITIGMKRLEQLGLAEADNYISIW